MLRLIIKRRSWKNGERGGSTLFQGDLLVFWQKREEITKKDQGIH